MLLKVKVLLKLCCCLRMAASSPDTLQTRTLVAEKQRSESAQPRGRLELLPERGRSLCCNQRVIGNLFRWEVSASNWKLTCGVLDGGGGDLGMRRQGWVRNSAKDTGWGLSGSSSHEETARPGQSGAPKLARRAAREELGERGAERPGTK